MLLPWNTARLPCRNAPVAKILLVRYMYFPVKAPARPHMTTCLVVSHWQDTSPGNPLVNSSDILASETATLANVVTKCLHASLLVNNYNKASAVILELKHMFFSCIVGM